jgi:hypothetical protein
MTRCRCRSTADNVAGFSEVHGGLGADRLSFSFGPSVGSALYGDEGDDLLRSGRWGGKLDGGPGATLSRRARYRPTRSRRTANTSRSPIRRRRGHPCSRRPRAPRTRAACGIASGAPRMKSMASQVTPPRAHCACASVSHQDAGACSRAPRYRGGRGSTAASTSGSRASVNDSRHVAMASAQP